MSEQEEEEMLWADAPLTVNSNLFHIYQGGRSLCGKYALGGMMQTTPVEEGDTWNDGGDCKACCRKAGLLEEADE